MLHWTIAANPTSLDGDDAIHACRCTVRPQCLFSEVIQSVSLVLFFTFDQQHWNCHKIHPKKVSCEILLYRATVVYFVSMYACFHRAGTDRGQSGAPCGHEGYNHGHPHAQPPIRGTVLRLDLWWPWNRQCQQPVDRHLRQPWKVRQFAWPYPCCPPVARRRRNWHM